MIHKYVVNANCMGSSITVVIMIYIGFSYLWKLRRAINNIIILLLQYSFLLMLYN